MEPNVSFHDDVYPILQEKCVNCHSPPSGKGYKISGLNMENYETLMTGTPYGPVIIPGDSKKSILNMLIEGRADESMLMPHDEDEPLSDENIRILHLWVSQGADNN
jgi:hypothetical protein